MAFPLHIMDASRSFSKIRCG